MWKMTYNNNDENEMYSREKICKRYRWNIWKDWHYVKKVPLEYFQVRVRNVNIYEYDEDNRKVRQNWITYKLTQNGKQLSKRKDKIACQFLFLTLYHVLAKWLSHQTYINIYSIFNKIFLIIGYPVTSWQHHQNSKPELNCPLFFFFF